jgi:hypothetical protein
LRQVRWKLPPDFTAAVRIRVAQNQSETLAEPERFEHARTAGLRRGDDGGSDQGGKGSHRRQRCRRSVAGMMIPDRTRRLLLSCGARHHSWVGREVGNKVCENLYLCNVIRLLAGAGMPPLWREPGETGAIRQTRTGDRLPARLTIETVTAKRQRARRRSPPTVRAITARPLRNVSVARLVPSFLFALENLGSDGER